MCRSDEPWVISFEENEKKNSMSLNVDEVRTNLSVDFYVGFAMH